jgi:hypothetical protein
MTQVADCLFTGVAVMPITLLVMGRPDLALVLFCPLLIIACFAAVWFGDYPARERAQRARSARQARAPSDE